MQIPPHRFTTLKLWHGRCHQCGAAIHYFYLSTKILRNRLSLDVSASGVCRRATSGVQYFMQPVHLGWSCTAIAVLVPVLNCSGLGQSDPVNFRPIAVSVNQIVNKIIPVRSLFILKRKSYVNPS